MSAERVLVVGGTGRTGLRVVEQLLERGIPVRAIVRSPHKLPKSVTDAPGFELVRGEILAMSTEEVAAAVAGCDAIVSCLGHVVSLQGVWGKPRDLVTRAVERLALSVLAAKPETPVRFVLMSSVSVNDPAGIEPGRGRMETAARAFTRWAMPPAKDNQTAADFLARQVGRSNPHLEWVTVRPDTLRDGEVTEYDIHQHLANSLFKPVDTNMANVAHFMCELVTDDATWVQWRGKLPEITNAA